MCGIVGHLGPHNSVEYVLEGLKRLEYRGYDSAGVSFIDEKGQLQVFKKSGKLQNLKDHLGDKKYIARACIGHTRWATHGEVNDTNSHPHSNEQVAIVHNGIIENAGVLKEQLTEKGFKFRSETDSEVFLALITMELEAGSDMLQAMTNSFQKLEGNSAFVVLDAKTSEIYAVKKGAPLVAGINEIGSEALVSSDPYALVGMADKIYFPEDDVVMAISGANKNLINFYDLTGNKTDRYQSKKQEMSLDVSEKGDFEHYMLKEIYEQPELMRSLTQFFFSGEGESSLRSAASFRPKKFYISACGTAFYAALVIRDFIEDMCRIPCINELASEFRYRNPLIDKDDVGLFISQSGETADTLAAQTLCKERGARTVSIVNVDGSTLYRECDENLLIRAGIEIGVASTKAFTQMVLTGRLLASALEGELDCSSAKKRLIDKYSLLAHRVDLLLEQVPAIQKVAEAIYNKKGFFFTGRGHYFPIALEGALKLKEIAYVHAEGYASGELKHGPIALIDEDMVNIAIVAPELYEKTVSNIQEIKARKGIIVTIGPAEDRSLEQMSDFYIPVEYEGLEELAPIYVNIVNQLLAYYMAKFKGTDIDKPRNLAKSVTVE